MTTNVEKSEFVYFTLKNFLFSKLKKQMKQAKHKLIALFRFCSPMLPITLPLSVFVLIVEITIYL